jgi:FAD/FMN-containing dehydrogenase
MALPPLTERDMIKLDLEVNKLRSRANSTPHQLQAQLQKFRLWFGVDPKTSLDITMRTRMLTIQLGSEITRPAHLIF